MTDAAAGGTDTGNPDGEQAAPALGVIAQYVKDLSFENPNAPQSLMNLKKTPDVSVNVDVAVRQIADELGMHESTISRVTTAKYMATPQGTFELKYFFGSGLGTDSGSAASSTAVRALIKQFVAAEKPAKPLSDNQLSEMLKEQGIDCARRTVAKYREALKIAPANLRKTL